jgi:hypothetical protein
MHKEEKGYKTLESGRQQTGFRDICDVPGTAEFV